MMSVCQILPAAHIFVDAAWQSKKRIFEQISIVFENACNIPRDKVFSALMQRERLGSTCIGNGGAIPHGRLEGIHAPLCALTLLQNPIQYGIGDEGGAVQTLFFLIAPTDTDDNHLQLLGEFSAMLSDTALINDLHQCHNNEAAAAKLKSWEAASTYHVGKGE